MLKSDSIGRKSKQTLLVLKKFCYFCSGSRFCASIWVYSMLIGRQPTPSWKLRSPNNFLGNKRAMGGKRVKTYRRRLLDALFKTYRILQIQNPVLNVATVDVPGVIISIPWRPCKHRLCPLGCNVICCIGLFTDAIFISAWALTLSVQLDLAMQEPWYVGRTTGRFHAWTSIYFVSVCKSKGTL